MTNVQRIPLHFKNESNRALFVRITDRPVEIQTTSLGAAADTLPPMSALKTFLGDDDIIVFTADAISIQKDEEKESNPNG